MGARSYQIPGGARVLTFHCDVCGGPASFSEGANLREALKTGDVKLAGHWFCGWRDGKPTCIGMGKTKADLFGSAA